MLSRRRFLLLILLALLTGFFPGIARADSGENGGNSGSDGDDHDSDDDGGEDGDGDDDDDDTGDEQAAALAGVGSGEAAPLKDILQIVRKAYPGEVVRIRTQRRGKDLIYRIRILDSSSRLIDVRISAISRRILKVESH
jgi:uncharacterized membrane protein YkoI